jgi:hypothetical protein
VDVLCTSQRIKISPVLEIGQCPQTCNRIASSKEVSSSQTVRQACSSLFFILLVPGVPPNQETRDDSSDVDQGFEHWWGRPKVSTGKGQHNQFPTRQARALTLCRRYCTDKGLRISNILMRCTFVRYRGTAAGILLMCEVVLSS